MNKFNVEMTGPQYQHLIAYPLAWSPATKGTISAHPVMVEINSPDDFPKYRGKTAGAIVIMGKPGNKPTAHFETRRETLHRG